jgi:hypothetical protein
MLAAALLVVASLAGTADAAASQTAGVQAHLLWSGVTPGQMDAQLDRARAADAGLVRVDLGWSSLEQDGKGAWSGWYLDMIDAVVAKAQARGIKVLFTVTWTPCWASSAPDSIKQGCAGAWWSRGVQYYPPSNPADYGDALSFLVRRYGNRVAAWEVWNEPNSDSYLRAPDKAASYAAILNAAYPAAKQADPDAVVVGGALQNADAPFAQALYEHGVAGHFDAFSIHPYDGDRDPLVPLEARHAAWTFTQGVPLVHDVLAGHGDGARPMWLTELGWSTSTTRGSATSVNGVSETTQADYLAKAYRQMQSWSYVAVGVWYELVDMGSDRAAWLSNLGLLRGDASEKPAFAAFRSASRALASAPPAAPSHRATPAVAPRLRVRLRRTRGRVYAIVRAPRRGTLVLRMSRSHRRTIRVRIRVARSGRLVRRLRPRALRHGHWRVAARLTGGRPARATTTLA